MIADPAVSRLKFEREVATARAHKPFHEQGVWILRAEYPLVFVALVTTGKAPLLHGVLCGVHIDFTDYDVRPPSVKFVDPLNELPLDFNTCWKFPKVNKITPTQGDATAAQQLDMSTFLQAFNLNKPFLCLPGVREYHETSAHTGDSWFLHRKKNMLVHLLTILQSYGSAIAQVQMQLQIQPILVSKIA
ncbi:putative metal-binding protein [Candidatus Ferrigenium straubiae]|jgi:hypothetical protein|uniref:putative metal-binding protein n=1 Tax=Candidatus Ferrigenium straubiae TaxID=2919506 RepID=UPI003F4AAC29